MNDFTKNELLIIHCGINTEINKYTGILTPSVFMLELRDKIEKMMDNYCEHPNEDRIFYGDVAVGECKNCHMVIL